jgi:hypothetical protein
MLGNLWSRKTNQAGAHGMRRLADAPPGVVLKAIRPKGAEAVRADLAQDDGVIADKGGELRYYAGRHYIVTYKNGDRAAVERRIFERTYNRRFDGKYEKRRDLTLHYFTLPYPVIVETLEGEKLAEAGDWIVRGVVGELYPVAAEVAREKYKEIN